jgi:hypothetical protein
VKRSGRDEPMWVLIHMCLEVMLEIYCSYPYLKLATVLCVSYYFLCFLFNKLREQEGRAGCFWKLRGEVVQTMNTHVSKCENDKILKIK